jgi:hypothetical protein
LSRFGGISFLNYPKQNPYVKILELAPLTGFLNKGLGSTLQVDTILKVVLSWEEEEI